MKIAQHNKPEEKETQLSNGRRITVTNFYTINQIGNALNYIEFFFTTD